MRGICMICGEPFVQYNSFLDHAESDHDLEVEA